MLGQDYFLNVLFVRICSLLVISHQGLKCGESHINLTYTDSPLRVAVSTGRCNTRIKRESALHRAAVRNLIDGVSYVFDPPTNSLWVRHEIFVSERFQRGKWWAWKDSNLRPIDYESDVQAP